MEEREMINLREKLYDLHARITNVTSYGVELTDILSGKRPPPPAGARFDVAFEGTLTGRLTGRVKGTDYAVIRADGCIELDVRAELSIDDGARVSLRAIGVATPKPGAPIELRENVRLETAYEAHAWVGRTPIWSLGAADLANGEIRLEAFVA
jgi:hypothetical protein